MQKHRKTGLVFFGFLSACLCIGFVLAKSAVIVGMVTEVDGLAHWHNDARKFPVQTLAELPENAKLVLAKDSKLIVVYLASGQQYQLIGPGVVQFKSSQPVGLNGTSPKAVGAAPVATGKPTKIDPTKVQTAGQTLVSTGAQQDANEPVGYAAPPPPPPPAPAPPPPPVAAMSPVRPETAADYMQAYEAAKRQAEAEAMAARQAKTEESAAWLAEREAARAAAEAAASAKQDSEKMAADTAPEPVCPPPADDNSEQAELAGCDDNKD